MKNSSLRLILFLLYVSSSYILLADNVNQSRVERLLQSADSCLNLNPRQSLYLGQQAIALLDANTPREAKSRCYFVIGSAEQLLGDFDLSFMDLYTAKQCLHEQDKRQLAEIASLMGRVYGKLGDYGKAIEYNDEATAFYKSVADSMYVADCYNERGVICHFMNDFEAAEQYLRKAMSINESLHDEAQLVKNLNNMCLYKGDTPERLKLIRRAIAINKRRDSKWSIAENYNNLAKQYFYAEKYDSALEALDVALDRANEIGAKEVIVDNYEYRAMVYYAMRQYKAAFDNQTKQFELSKELQGSSKLRSIEREVSNREHQEKAHAFEIQSREYEISILRRNLLLLVAALLLGAALFFMSKHQKSIQLLKTKFKFKDQEQQMTSLELETRKVELQEAHTNLQQSKREVTNFAAFIRSENEMIEKIKQMIKEAYHLQGLELQTHLRRVNLFISNHMSADTEASLLLSSIEERNSEFLHRLIILHPNLTKGERHLSLLLRGGISTKDISMIMGCSPKTVNMNRYRLRKALRLTTEQDLEDYVNSI